MTCGRPVPGFAAFSGTGRATLLVRLIPFLEERGVRVPLIKQAHHDFDIDKPGKDSCDLRKAGTRQVTVASNRRGALVTENTVPAEPRLNCLLEQLAAIDLVLVEVFRHLPYPEVELHRASLGRPLLCREDASIIAVAADIPLDTDPLTRLDLNDTTAIAEYMKDRMDEHTHEHTN